MANSQPTTDWVENSWYIAAYADELADAPVGRTLLGRAVVLFRDGDRRAHALSGICPHRMMPMELGKVKGDRLVCAYHGLAFATDGRCVDAPTVGQPPDCRLDCYPLVEAGPLLWIWLGDPALADTVPIPNQAEVGIGVDGWNTQCVRHNVLRARWSLLVDNLFDLSHLGFIHASILGEGGVSGSSPQIREREGRLWIVRTQEDVEVDGYRRFLHPHIGDRMSTLLDTEQFGVGLINAGSRTWEGTSADGKAIGATNFLHGITPETRHSTHYFNMVTRDYRIDDEVLSAALAAQNQAVIQQDIDALEAIEAMFAAEVPLPREISIKTDAGALRARARMIRMLEAEEARAAS